MRVINAVLPPRCMVSGAPVDMQGMIAPAAWRDLNFVTEPYCKCCGVPFPFAVPGETSCVSCLREEPPFDSARSVLIYDDQSRNIVLRFKHADQLHMASSLAEWLYRAGQALFEEADLVLPVPLHRSRLIKRRYNQAALLAQKLAVRADLPCLPDGLLRIRATPTQGHLGYKERHKNVKRAFSVNPRYQARIAGASIILVDDVYTSGATVKECAKALRNAGASRIDVLTLARVVRES